MNKDAAKSKKRPAPVGVRVTPDERTELASRARALRLTVSGYVKFVVFNTPPPRRSRRPPPNATELSRLLSAVGSIGANVNRCALIANMGSWPEAQRLQAACDDIQWMRSRLMLALGMTPDHPTDHPDP